MKYYDGNFLPNAIKIIPMNNDEDKEPEFANKKIEEIQKIFFTDRLPYDKYRFREKRIADIEGTLVLFQFDKHIVAAALLDKLLLNDEDDYRGYYLFYPDSIIIFDKINKFDFREIKPSFTNFGSFIKNIEIEYYPALLDLFKRKNFKFSYQFIDQEDEQYQSEVEHADDEPVDIPDAVTHTVTRLPRNAQVGYQVLKSSNYQCDYDPNHRWFTSKVTSKNYIELHHLIPMAFQNRFSSSLDVRSNVVPLCPLCHKILHHGTTEERNPIIRKLHQNRKAKLSTSEIPITIDSLISLY